MNSNKKNTKTRSVIDKRYLLFFFFLCTITFQISCKKFLEVPPPATSITGDFVYTTDATSISVLTELYTSLNSNVFQGQGSMPLFAGLAADEYKLNIGITDVNYVGYYYNNLAQSSASISGGEHWAPLYNLVFRCNAAIEGLNASKTLTPLIKKQLIGEAKFMRAFIYFYLVNMFGDVPLTLTTDPEINALIARSSKADVYEQIKNDLKNAEDLLNENYLDPSLLKTTIERVRPTKWAAAALLSRVYLYTGEWSSAEVQANLVINNSILFSLPPTLNEVFLKNSKEAIWQIQPTEKDYNTLDARTLIIPSTGPTTDNPVYLSDQLLSSFETSDKRIEHGNWIDATIYQISDNPVILDTVVFPLKYKINFSPNVNSINGLTEYFMVLRLAEQYLIRAEARTHLGNITGGQSDLNAIRNRAGLPNTITNDQSSLLAAILDERRHELFSEWGHRWFDLKRTGKINEVMTAVTPIKSGGTNTWKSYQQLYPLPLTELQRDANLVQNPGYN